MSTAGISSIKNSSEFPLLLDGVLQHYTIGRVETVYAEYSIDSYTGQKVQKHLSRMKLS